MNDWAVMLGLLVLGLWDQIMLSVIALAALVVLVKFWQQTLYVLVALVSSAFVLALAAYARINI